MKEAWARAIEMWRVPNSFNLLYTDEYNDILSISEGINDNISTKEKKTYEG